MTISDTLEALVAAVQPIIAANSLQIMNKKCSSNKLSNMSRLFEEQCGKWNFDSDKSWQIVAKGHFFLTFSMGQHPFPLGDPAMSQQVSWRGQHVSGSQYWLLSPHWPLICFEETRITTTRHQIEISFMVIIVVLDFAALRAVNPGV